jgi:phage terminase large subunit
LDFGFSNDPTAIAGIYKYNGGYIFDEEMYRKGLSNKDISDILLNLNIALVKADAAEPKSIEEIYNYGVTIMAAPKGPDSVNQGIQFIQGQRISVTSRSLNLLREYRNYLWQMDKSGRMLNVPNDFDNHLMDAVRYGMTGLEAPEKKLAQAATVVRHNYDPF